MSPSENGGVLLLLGELGEALDDDGELGDDNIASVTEEDEVGVVGNVAGGRAEVDNGSGGGGMKTEDVDVGHDIVAALLLLDGSLGHLGSVEVLYSEARKTNEEGSSSAASSPVCDGERTYKVSLHLLDSSVWDVESELLLSDSEVEPQLAPGSKASLRCAVRSSALCRLYELAEAGKDSPKRRRAWPFLWRHSDSRDWRRDCFERRDEFLS